MGKKSSNILLGSVPFLFFLVLYVASGLYFSFQGDSEAFFHFPAPAAALLAFGLALAISGKQIEKVVEYFTAGIADQTVILMCLVFLLAGAFSAVSQASGGVDATVNLGLSILPKEFLLPSLFIIACFVSLAMGTSMGTIGAVVPIAIALATKAGIDPGLATGTVLGGAMFGDNLSIISDTTIASTGTQNCSMRDKMWANIPLALPAAGLALFFLFLNAPTSTLVDVGTYEFLRVLPYIIVIALSLSGMNVLAVLMIGIVFSGLIGAGYGDIGFVSFGQSIYKGFLGMADVFFLTIFIAGLAGLATATGTLERILDGLRRHIRGRKSAEGVIALIVSISDWALANNTIAILVSGRLCKKISDDYKLFPPRIASILDIFSCVFQGLLPYAPQMLLAAGLSQLSPFQILPYTWYPMILGIFGMAAIFFQFPKKQVNNHAI